jgi:hypothetical protein
MMAQRTGLEITLLIGAGVSLPLALGRALAAAERRGWIRLHGAGKGSASAAFAVMEDMFSASRSQARQLLQEQKRVGRRAPTPGDGPDDWPSVTGRFAGQLTVSMNGSQTSDAPDERHVIASGH